VLEVMAEVKMPLLVHSEVTDSSVDVFDRERVFIDTIIGPLVSHIPGLLCHCTQRVIIYGNPFQI
jgi:dihydroorotase